MGLLTAVVGILDADGNRVDPARADGSRAPLMIQLGDGIGVAEVIENGGTTTVVLEAVPVETVAVAGLGLNESPAGTFNVSPAADGSTAIVGDTIAVGVLASDAQHGNRGGGALHADVVASGASGFMLGADKAKLDAATVNATANTLVKRGDDGVLRQSKAAIGQAVAMGVELLNATAAVDGTSQFSPASVWTGYSWSGAISGASTKQEWLAVTATEQSVGDGVNESSWVVAHQRAGAGGFVPKFSVSMLGDVTVTRSIAAGGQVTSTGFYGVTNADVRAASGSKIRLYEDATLLATVEDSGGTTLVTVGARPLSFKYTGSGGEFAFQDDDGDVLRASAGSGELSSDTLTVLRLAGGGAATFSHTLSFFAGQIASSVSTGAFNATPEFDFDAGNHHEMGALTANVTAVTYDHAVPGGLYTISMVQDGTGGRTVTGWHADFEFGSFTSAVDGTASKRTVWTFLVSSGGKLRCIGKTTGLPA